MRMVLRRLVRTSRLVNLHPHSLRLNSIFRFMLLTLFLTVWLTVLARQLQLRPGLAGRSPKQSLPRQALRNRTQALTFVLPSWWQPLIAAVVTPMPM